MKKITLLGAMAAALLSGCTKVPAEHGENGGRLPEGTRIYINAGLALPTASGTRSGTDNYPNNEGDDENDKTNSNANPDFEYGHDYESDVRSVLLVIADSEDRYITHTFVSNVSEAPVSGAKFDFVVTGELSYEDLEKAYNGTDGEGKDALLKTDQEVHVWVYCNYTGAMVEEFGKVKLTDTDWINFTGTVEEDAANPSKPSDIPNTIWAKNSFLMTNANNVDNVFTFPATIEEWDPYTDKSNPYLLSKDVKTPDQKMELRPIHVERAAARIDFRDASENGDCIYPLTYITKRPTVTADDDPSTDNGESLNLFSVQLNRMSLVNMSKNFYYLRRVSADGTATDAEVGGYEYYKSDTDCNYVVDTDYSDKNTKKIGAKNDYFNFPLFTADSSYYREAWYVDKISDVLDDKTHDSDNWKGSASNKYYIWRYVTENTIPGVDNQITVQSTGIVFKGSIILGEDGENASESLISGSVKEALKMASEGSVEEKLDLPDLYSFEGRLYAGISELVSAAAESKGSTLNTAVNLALKHWAATASSKRFAYREDIPGTETPGTIVLTAEICNALIKGGSLVDTPYADFKDFTIDFNDTPTNDNKEDIAKAVYNFNKAVAKVQPEELGITIYRASNEKDGDGWGYYCYYFYWNRHNDNRKSGKMGPMEFATVRNNVYKLAVKTISEFGHPRVTDFDPDPVEPKDPDEEPKVYFQVQVDVLPWVVRENVIEF